MTIEELRQKPIGVLEKRSFTLIVNDREYEENYFLAKGKDGVYFIGFSDDGSYCSRYGNEESIIRLLNNKELSDEEAFDIYMQSPHLSCWMDD